MYAFAFLNVKVVLPLTLETECMAEETKVCYGLDDQRLGQAEIIIRKPLAAS